MSIDLLEPVDLPRGAGKVLLHHLHVARRQRRQRPGSLSTTLYRLPMSLTRPARALWPVGSCAAIRKWRGRILNHACADNSMLWFGPDYAADGRLNRMSYGDYLSTGWGAAYVLIVERAAPRRDVTGCATIGASHEGGARWLTALSTRIRARAD